MKNKTKKNYFYVLPYEIILYIFSFIPRLRPKILGIRRNGD